MVCKRSLYCWKNGPCASDQARKQIWEDNIRFRESLRSMNQSDHYWSFQISNGRHCSCIEDPYTAQRQPLHRKFLSNSLQKLDCVDCASITHDIKSKQLERRRSINELHCPLHSAEVTKFGDKSTNGIYGPALAPINAGRTVLKFNQPDNNAKNILTPCDLNNNRSSRMKPPEDLPKFCPRYKNTLTSVPLNPSVRFKFSSQPTLLSDTKRSLQRSNMETKSSSPSMDNLKVECRGEREVKDARILSDLERNRNLLEMKKKQHRLPKRNGLTTLGKLAARSDKVTTDDIDDSQPAETRKHKHVQRNVYTPLSKTTRTSVMHDRQTPFVTFGCNNVNNDVGSKRTHNVLASKVDVYPNALNAKQQRHDMIMRFLNQEKDFQRKLLPDFKKKLINHSSVWAAEQEKVGKDDATWDKAAKRMPPLGDKRVKSQSLHLRDAKTSIAKPNKVFRRSNSQAYFY